MTDQSPSQAAEMDAGTFQARVQPWMMACFGMEIAADRLERNDRFIEEALELVQATGYDKARANQLVDYVYGRPQGDINQEVGGVMITLAAHCLAYGVDMHEAGETELARIWTKVEQIREKQKTKPKGSALPIPSGPSQAAALTPEVREAVEAVRAYAERLGKRSLYARQSLTLLAALSAQQQENERLREFYWADKAVRDVGLMNSTPEMDARRDRARSALSDLQAPQSQGG